MTQIAADELKSKLQSRDELALVDVREEGVFATEHLLFAVSIPLVRLEIDFAWLVPRKGTPVVLCDAGEGDTCAREASAKLAHFGYENVAILDNGTAGWRTAGYELFSGTNVPSKAFGEYVEHQYATPHITANELTALQEAATDLVVLDSRPMAEFHKMSIPGGICCPGAELAYRIHDLAPQPDTLVVVNCAGRTRSIIGSQALINAQIPNRVVALKDGTMGWHLAGHPLEHGQNRVAPEGSVDGLARSKEVAGRVATRFGVRKISPDQLAEFEQQSDSRSLFVFDVRSFSEFDAGHLPASRSAPGGQLVQATDEFVGVRNARLVLVDDTGVRATMTASWLIQMGWPEVYVLDRAVDQLDCVAGAEMRTQLGPSASPAQQCSVDELGGLLAAGTTQLIDLADSRTYRQGHLPGARLASRGDLPALLAAAPAGAHIVLLSPDGRLASVSIAELKSDESYTVLALTGGTRAWQAAGGEMETSRRTRQTDEGKDVWYKPYERSEGIDAAMRAYLEWETGLVAQIERDGCASFRRFET